MTPTNVETIAWDDPTFGAGNDFPGAEMSLGLGNDPGPRRVATISVFAYQSGNGAPCGFQAQGTLWTSG